MKDLIVFVFFLFFQCFFNEAIILGVLVPQTLVWFKLVWECCSCKLKTLVYYSRGSFVFFAFHGHSPLRNLKPCFFIQLLIKMAKVCVELKFEYSTDLHSLCCIIYNDVIIEL